MSHDVLVVEDERSIALSLEFLMKQAGHSVRTAVDGRAALEALAERAPDLVLLDVNLPELDGYEVCRRIRESAAWRETRVLMLTAKGRDIEREKGLAAGADGYITKPFATREVVEQVRALLEAA